MKYGYYPGCSLHGTAKEYDLSTRSIFEYLGLELKEIEDWNCCGASPAHQSSEELSLVLPLRNLFLAEKQGFKEVISPCAACYHRLRSLDKRLEEDSSISERFSDLVGGIYLQGIKIRHILDFLKEEVGIERIAETKVKSLNGLKVASYYGCLLTRPPEIAKVDPDWENPIIMDDLIEAIEGKPVSWSHKTECCGASFALSRKDIVQRLSKEIIEAALLAGAEVISVACPLCHSNLDMRQSEINKRYKKNFELPILFITQLIGLSQGKRYKELGLQKPIVSPKKILKERGII